MLPKSDLVFKTKTVLSFALVLLFTAINTAQEAKSKPTSEEAQKM